MPHRWTRIVVSFALVLSGCGKSSGPYVYPDFNQCAQTQPDLLLEQDRRRAARGIAAAELRRGRCDDCAPNGPADLEAFCASDGHCDVRPAS